MSDYLNVELGQEALRHMHWLLGRYFRTHFLMQGTALGAYRDGGFTPTERDIDIGLITHPHDECTLRTFANILTGFEEWEVETYSRPFSHTRIVCAWYKGEVKVDLVSWMPWVCLDGREVLFAVSPERPWNRNDRYAIVHDRKLLATHQQVELFGKTWNVPAPIEKYLEAEYGVDWKTPREDHISRTRDYDFMQRELVLG